MFFKLFMASVFVVMCTADSCLHCICKKESGCRNIGCNYDAGSLSCGYYQITRLYYIDCGTPGRRSGESINTAWKRCANDYNCATKCVQNYVKRYSGKCSGKGSCEKMARLHNGGPNGCRTSATNKYWNSVKSCCHCS